MNEIDFTPSRWALQRGRHGLPGDISLIVKETAQTCSVLEMWGKALSTRERRWAKDTIVATAPDQATAEARAKAAQAAGQLFDTEIKALRQEIIRIQTLQREAVDTALKGNAAPSPQHPDAEAREEEKS